MKEVLRDGCHEQHLENRESNLWVIHSLCLTYRTMLFPHHLGKVDDIQDRPMEVRVLSGLVSPPKDQFSHVVLHLGRAAASCVEFALPSRLSKALIRIHCRKTQENPPCNHRYRNPRRFRFPLVQAQTRKHWPDYGLNTVTLPY